MMLRTASIVFVLAATACVLPEYDSDPVETGQVEQALQCPIWTCGSNSPVLLNYGIWELNELGLPNGQGFSIAGFTKNGVPFDLDVKDGKLYGMQNGLSVLSGLGLVGAEIELHKAPNIVVFIRVRGLVSNVPYWAQKSANPQPTLEAYQLEWQQQGSTVPWRNLCSRASDKEIDGMNGLTTLLFDGDRIDAEHKRVLSAVDGSWFNIGCAGHALAKMALTGHTEAAKNADGFVTTSIERQTMLKMIVADYCGGGFPYTITGEPLSWKDDKGWMHHSAQLQGIEARWGPNGAVCLQTPRLVANPPQSGDSTFPNGVLAAMAENGCSVPKCKTLFSGNSDPENLMGYHLVSANPP